MPDARWLVARSAPFLERIPALVLGTVAPGVHRELTGRAITPVPSASAAVLLHPLATALDAGLLFGGEGFRHVVAVDDRQPTAGCHDGERNQKTGAHQPILQR